VSARGKARRRAVEILFEAEQRHEDARQVMERRRLHSDALVSPYAEELVLGVLMRRGEIDEYLETYSQGWTLERMPAVDRNVLRVGAWELLFNDDVPDAVAVAEAVDVAKELSGDESPGFVNGLLGRLQKMKPTLLG
jgi:N utilization substance protein B